MNQPMVDLGPEWDYYRVEIPFLKGMSDEQKREVIAEGLQRTAEQVPSITLPEYADSAK